LSATQSGHQA
jgi:hypothetical protein